MVLTFRQLKYIERHFYPGASESEVWQHVKSATWKRYRGSRIGGLMYRRYVMGENSKQARMNEATYYNYRNEFLLFAAIELAKAGVNVTEL